MERINGYARYDTLKGITMSFLSDTLSDLSTLFNGTGPITRDDKYQDALRELLAHDVGRTAYFDVFIPVRSGGTSTVRFFCHSAELPGESTATVSQKIYGVTEKFSVMTGYNDITLSFYTYGSEVELIRKMFLSWITFITGRGESFKGSGNTTYNVKYKSEYTQDIVITQYAVDGKPLLRVKLFSAFPVAINQVPLDWSAQNQAQSLNVTFAYTEYEYEFLYVENESSYSRGALGELFGTALQTAAIVNSISGAFKSGNPLAATSTLSNFRLSSPEPYQRRQ